MEEWKLEPARDLGLSLSQRAQSLRRENGLIENGLHLFWGLSWRAYFRLWHRLEIHGQENLPAAPPFTLIANHTSHLDALALACSLRFRWRHCIFPIAAGDTFFKTPSVAAFAAFVMNALPMWRRHCGSHSLLELRERLVEGPSIYLIFPEGTRARDGKIAPFKPGLGMLVAGTSVPVVPCFLNGTFDSLPPGKKFPLPRKIVLRFGKPLTFPATKNERTGWVEAAKAAQETVTGLSQGTSER